jgi:hypothetical protein
MKVAQRRTRDSLLRPVFYNKWRAAVETVHSKKSLRKQSEKPFDNLGKRRSLRRLLRPAASDCFLG